MLVILAARPCSILDVDIAVALAFWLTGFWDLGLAYALGLFCGHSVLGIFEHFLGLIWIFWLD